MLRYRTNCCRARSGFAFVEYATEEETRTAVSSLRTTHLYGRHVIVEASGHCGLLLYANM